MIGLWNSIFVIVISAMMLCGCENNAESTQSTLSVKPFVTPNDGKLVEKQVTDYIAIRKQIVHEANARTIVKNGISNEINEDAKSKADVRYFDEIEKAVAELHGMSYEEYLWIKDTVINTQTRQWLNQYYEANNKIVNLLDQTLTRYKDISKDNDKQEQQKMTGYVKEMKKELKNIKEKIPQAEIESDVFIHNSTIINKYKSELESIN